MGSDPCMKMWSYTAGGRSLRWPLKAGTTVCVELFNTVASL